MKMALVDDDYVVRAKADLSLKKEDDQLEKFFREIEEELITGKTAFLEIEGLENDPVTFEISKYG
jgi:hypothetical protein